MSTLGTVSIPSFMETLHHTTATSLPVSSILHVAKLGPFVPLPEATSTLLDAALILGKHGLHRVFVVDEGEGPTGVD